MNLKTLNVQISCFFPGFELKIQFVLTFCANSMYFSGHGKLNDQIPGFQGIAGRVGILMVVKIYNMMVH